MVGWGCVAWQVLLGIACRRRFPEGRAPPAIACRSRFPEVVRYPASRTVLNSTLLSAACAAVSSTTRCTKMPGR